MWEFLNNNWVIAIGGGIPSGLFVALITRKIFSKRDNNEYLQSVSQSNKEVIYAIRPTISEMCLPTLEVLKCIKSSTARKYNVQEIDMINIGEICDDLIKEVMDTSFISCKTKEQYCAELLKIKNPPNEKPNKGDAQQDKKQSENQGYKVSNRSTYKDNMLNYMTFMIGTIASMVTIISSLLLNKETISIFDNLLISKDIASIVVPATGIILSTSVISFMYPLIRKIVYRNNIVKKLKQDYKTIDELKNEHNNENKTKI